MQPTIHRSHPPLPPSDSHKQGGEFNSLLQVVFVIPYPPFSPPCTYTITVKITQQHKGV